MPMAPGSGLLETPEQAMPWPGAIGYPVMLKATAGGGGIGMRLCREEAELADAFAAVQRLGRNNFKHAGLYLEKYIQRRPAHRGADLRRRQRQRRRPRRARLLRPAPQPEGHRGNARSRHRRRSAQQLFDAAVQLGEAVGYQSAGTVEFIFDDDARQFYFLEVNTRLQVEHAVTEMVTGLDLVEWMVRQAAGELSLEGFRAKPAGASIQVRLYAEDPAKNFQPSCGVLTDVAFPPGVRGRHLGRARHRGDAASTTRWSPR